MKNQVDATMTVY